MHTQSLIGQQLFSPWRTLPVFWAMRRQVIAGFVQCIQGGMGKGEERSAFVRCDLIFKMLMLLFIKYPFSWIAFLLTKEAIAAYKVNQIKTLSLCCCQGKGCRPQEQHTFWFLVCANDCLCTIWCQDPQKALVLPCKSRENGKLFCRHKKLFFFYFLFSFTVVAITL